MRTEGQGVVDVCGGWDAPRKPGGSHIREREKPRGVDRMLVRGRGEKGRPAHSQRDAEGRELGSSRMPRPEPSRETETYGYFSWRGPGSRGSLRSAGLPLPRPPASRAERVTSGPLRAPPTRRRRRRRLREPEDARWRPAGSAARARRAGRAHTGRAPPIFSRCAPPLSGYGGGGGGACLRCSVKSSACSCGVRAAAEADLPSLAKRRARLPPTRRAPQLPALDRCGRRAKWHGPARTAAPRRPTRKLFSRKPEAGLGA